MIADFLKNKKIKQFLAHHPEERWMNCLEALILHSIFDISQKYPCGLKTDQLCSIVSPHTQKNPNFRNSEGHLKRSTSLMTSKIPRKYKLADSPPKHEDVVGKTIFKLAEAKKPVKEPSTCPVEDVKAFANNLKYGVNRFPP